MSVPLTVSVLLPLLTTPSAVLLLPLIAMFDLVEEAVALAVRVDPLLIAVDAIWVLLSAAVGALPAFVSVAVDDSRLVALLPSDSAN